MRHVGIGEIPNRFKECLRIVFGTRTDSEGEPNHPLSRRAACELLRGPPVKYGALSVPGGRVIVRWSVDRESRPVQFVLCWEENIGAAAIVAFTSSGTTAARIARKRPNLPILAITPNLRVARQMALLWGAHSVHGENSRSFEQMLAVTETTVHREAFARAGDTVVVVAGMPFGH